MVKGRLTDLPLSGAEWSMRNEGTAGSEADRRPLQRRVGRPVRSLRLTAAQDRIIARFACPSTGTNHPLFFSHSS